jgi:Zn-dependent hydrolases, including glyoxylases
MNRLITRVLFVALAQAVLLGQGRGVQIEGKIVAQNDDVVFRQIDDHTWIGTAHVMANESLYLLEGNDRALLIDAGTRIADLDKVVASITNKPVMLAATHAHPDHTGSAINYFPELNINPGDAAAPFLANYKGKINPLTNGQVIDLGGRTVEVVFTPAHTPGATTFIDKDAGYGFSGDSFGSGNLLLSGTFSTLIATCQKTAALMEKYKIKHLYPGHFNGRNFETKQRLDDEVTISRDVLAGKLKGEPNPRGLMGLNLVVSAYGVRINYSDKSMQ